MNEAWKPICYRNERQRKIKSANILFMYMIRESALWYRAYNFWIVCLKFFGSAAKLFTFKIHNRLIGTQFFYHFLKDISDFEWKVPQSLSPRERKNCVEKLIQFIIKTNPSPRSISLPFVFLSPTTGFLFCSNLELWRLPYIHTRTFKMYLPKFLPPIWRVSLNEIFTFFAVTHPNLFFFVFDVNL